jgi:hypothetical protein
VEALGRAESARRLAPAELRGASCERFEFHVDLRVHHDQLATPKEWLRGQPCVTGEVWLDEQQRIRHIEFKDEARNSADQANAMVDSADSLPSTSTVLGLWDYGIDASIDTPQVESPQRGTISALAAVGLGLWRRRRDFKDA